MSEEREMRMQRPDVKLALEVSSVDDALAEATAQWHLPVDDLEAEVLSSDSGFLGLFGKKLHVEVRPKAPLLLLQGQHYLEKLLELMNLDVSVSLKIVSSESVKFDAPDSINTADGESDEDESDHFARDAIEIEGPDAEKFIVGRYGDVLKSLEYLLNLSLRDPSVEPRVRIDSCGYRERRTRSLERLAEATARQAVEYGRPIRLEPMLSWERWVIHMALKERDDVRTESVGESPMRKVVVMPTYENDSGINGYSSRSYPRPRFRSRFDSHSSSGSSSESRRRGPRRRY